MYTPIYYQFRKEGLFCVIKNRDKPESVEPISYLIDHLDEFCVIQEGVNLFDIMSCVRKDNRLCSFLSSYLHMNIDKYHEEIDKTAVPFDGKSVLELCWRLDVEDEFEENALDIFVDFSEIREGQESHYCLELCPITDIMNIPVILNEHVERSKNGLPYIYIIRSLKWWEVWKRLKLRRLEKYKKPFKVLDVICGIYGEIGFCGSPQNANDIVKELDRRLKDLESGKTKEIPMEEVMRRLKKKE